MWLILIFIVVPIVEIGLFIQVGSLIGLWPTLGLVILMAFLGSWLLQAQGAMAFADLQRSVHDLRDPSEPLAHGVLIIFAGLLMITPGFFTDILGMSLLIRPVRSLVLRYLGRRFSVVTRPNSGAQPRPGDPPEVIDGEFYEVSPDEAGQRPSGWTRH